MWMQEQTGNSFLQCGGLLQAGICADGECGGHLQEGGRHLCQVCNGLPPGYALPSQSWHHCSLWIWCSSDSQQVGSAEFATDTLTWRAAFRACNLVHVDLSALLQRMSHCQHCCSAHHAFSTAAQQHTRSTLAHNPLSTLVQRILNCPH